jgi:hypothetical protein
VVTLYDNPTAGSGTVLAIVAASAALGTTVDVQSPAGNGITAVGATSSPAVTVSYS